MLNVVSELNIFRNAHLANLSSRYNNRGQLMVRRRNPLGELRELPLTATFQPWRYRRSIWTQPAITSPYNSSSAYTTSTRVPWHDAIEFLTRWSTQLRPPAVTPYQIRRLQIYLKTPTRCFAITPSVASAAR